MTLLRTILDRYAHVPCAYCGRKFSVYEAMNNERVRNSRGEIMHIVCERMWRTNTECQPRQMIWIGEVEVAI